MHSVRLTCQHAPGILLTRLLPSDGITDMDHHGGHFEMDAGNQNSGPHVCMQQALYCLDNQLCTYAFCFN